MNDLPLSNHFLHCITMGICFCQAREGGSLVFNSSVDLLMFFLRCNKMSIPVSIATLMSFSVTCKGPTPVSSTPGKHDSYFKLFRFLLIYVIHRII